MIFDAHVHIYPDNIALKAAKTIGQFYGIPMRADGTVGMLLTLGKRAGFDRYLVHSVAVTWERVRAVNDYIASTVKAYPDLFIGFGTLHAEHPNIEKEISHILSSGLCGVKLHPDFQHFCLDDVKCIEMLKIVADYGLPCLIHTGDKRYPYSEPVRMARALDQIPSLKVICAHLGGWSIWEQGVHVLAGREQVWVDTSSSLYAINPDTAAQIIRAYGTKRVLFGTDYPMWNPAEELKRFKALPLTPEEQADILGNNLMTFLEDIRR